MGTVVEAEVTRLRGLYTTAQSLPPDDLLELVASVLRLDEANTTKLTEINVTVGTLAAGNITGASVFVQLVSINATPGTQTTRTAALMIADQGIGLYTVSYQLRITNTGAGTFTLAAGTGVTLTGTMTVPVNTWRDFIVTLNGAAVTATIRAIGTGTFT